MLKRLPAASVVLVQLLILPSLWGTHPVHHETTTQEEFLEGEMEGVAVTTDGTLTLAPEFEEQLDTEEAFIHSMVMGRNGTIYAGTGNNGKIFRLPSSGAGGEWVTLEEPAVYALAVDGQNRVYAGTSPDGKVYRIDPEGNAEEFFDPKQKFIWDLAVDNAGNLFVATGPNGMIYKVSPSGDGQEFYDSEETHIVSLEWDLEGNLLSGSAPEGLLFRFDSGGRPFVLLDSSLEEVKGIAVNRYGHIFVTALSGKGRQTASASSSSASASDSNSNSKEDKTEESTVKVAASAEGSQLHVYEIDRENMVSTLYSTDDQLAFDLALRSDGTVLLATGNEGRILSLDPLGHLTLLVDSDEEQITRLIERGQELYVGTGNLGKIYRVAPQAGSSGTYESEVVDAGMVARWGTIRWETIHQTESGTIQLFTRSGNTEDPDRTWSDWSSAYSSSQGSTIASDNARFLQWKAEFSDPQGTGSVSSRRNSLDQVTITYQQQNVAPKLNSLTVHAPGIAFAKIPTNPAAGIKPGGPDGAHARSLPKAIRDLETPRVTPPSRRIYVPGARSFSWKADDPNEDSLTYSLFYRNQDSGEWRLLLEDSDETEHTIDGASFPDGRYTVKVLVSDRLSNPPGVARTDELISKPFVIANSSPEIEWQSLEWQGSSANGSVQVRTLTSPLYQVEYRVDSGDWKVLLPEDGITDSTRESYRLEIEDLDSGPHKVSIRAIDLVGNIATRGRDLQVP